MSSIPPAAPAVSLKEQWEAVEKEAAVAALPDDLPGSPRGIHKARLSAAAATLRDVEDVLAPFAEVADSCDGEGIYGPLVPDSVLVPVRVGALRAARSLLSRLAERTAPGGR